MLLKRGWDESGLGKDGQGRRMPVKASSQGGRGGLGSASVPASMQGAKYAPLGRSNRGYDMLVRSGWEGNGLGKDGTGMREPVEATAKEDRGGIGRPEPPRREEHSPPAEVLLSLEEDRAHTKRLRRLFDDEPVLE